MDDVLVVKRDGRKVKFDSSKIQGAIKKAYGEKNSHSSKIAHDISFKIQKYIKKLDIPEISVEDIQDMIEKELMKLGETNVAKNYILYRAKRTEIREVNSKLMLEYKDITFGDAESVDAKRENANVDGNTAMGTMLQYGVAGSKIFALKHIVKKEHAKAHKDGLIHIHDMDFLPIGTTTCTQIDIEKLFKNGFSTGHGHLREPQDIMSYAALAAIAIQSNQNDQHGGQSIPNFDYGLALGVLKTFKREFKKYIKDFTEVVCEIEIPYDSINNIINNIKSIDVSNDVLQSLSWKLFEYYGERSTCDRIIKSARDKAYELTERKTYQAMEGFIHNLNTMHSRAGAQVPFSSINFGTDTSIEGRMVTRNLLLAVKSGLGNGETAIFPISIFKVKEGVNFNPDDPNYDLFKLSMEVSAKRLFPNFSFLDAPFNLQYYKDGKPETETTYMGCRTRVIGSVFEESDGNVYGRGNLSFTTINLPRLGIKHGIVLGKRQEADLNGFYNELDKTINLVADQLLDRYEIQKKKKVRNFPFLMGQGNWYNSDKLNWEDTLNDVLKHGTLSCGFIGLAETLIALTGKHHGESESSQQLGLDIIKHIKKRIDNLSQKHKLNFTLLASPAEGLSGRFVAIDKSKYGEIKNVTDKEYYTNSFHIPVYYNISIMKKIELEAPYHEFTNAGHITYIELDGDPSNNLDAFEAIIRKMKTSGIGYGSINHPLDRDPVCGYNGIIHNKCPKCGRLDGKKGPKFERIRRITGYLVGTVDRWNNAKLAELNDRVKHNNCKF